MEQRLQPGAWPRHRHRAAYAAIVLSGGYLEAGGAGRWTVEAGDVVVHPPFDAHLNHLRGQAWVLNLTLDPLTDLPPVFRVDDLDGLERAWREDPHRAAGLLVPAATARPLDQDWPDALAADLARDPGLNLGEWARKRGLSPSTVSRGFAATFGVSPARYRAERRALSAWRRLMTERAPLAELAVDCGYADQAHLTRAITALTGAPPSRWRGRKSVQDHGAAAA